MQQLDLSGASGTLASELGALMGIVGAVLCSVEARAGMQAAITSDSSGTPARCPPCVVGREGEGGEFALYAAFGGRCLHAEGEAR